MQAKQKHTRTKPFEKQTSKKHMAFCIVTCFVFWSEKKCFKKWRNGMFAMHIKKWRNGMFAMHTWYIKSDKTKTRQAKVSQGWPYNQNQPIEKNKWSGLIQQVGLTNYKGAAGIGSANRNPPRCLQRRRRRKPPRHALVTWRSLPKVPPVDLTPKHQRWPNWRAELAFFFLVFWTCFLGFWDWFWSS